MTLAEIYAALEKVEGGSLMIEAIKTELSKANGDAKSNREAKEKAEGSLKELQAQLEELKKTNEGLQGTKKTQETELSELQKQVAALIKQTEEAKAASLAEKKARTDAEIRSQVVDAFTKKNAMDPQEFSVLVAPKIKINEKGEYYYVKKDGTNGTIEDATNEWLEGKAWAVKDNQNAGNGAGGNGDNKAKSVAESFESALGI